MQKKVSEPFIKVHSLRPSMLLLIDGSWGCAWLLKCTEA